MEQTVKDWVSRDTFGYGYLLDFYQRGAGGGGWYGGCGARPDGSGDDDR